jgi:acetyl esterase
MTSKLELDTRLDPRIKAYFAGLDLGAAKPNVSSREELLAQENTPEALAAQDRANALFNAMDSEDVAPSAGLTVRTETVTSSPDGTPSRSSTSGRMTTRPCHASSTFTAAACSSVLAI